MVIVYRTAYRRAPTTFLYATERRFLSSFDNSTPVSVTDFMACAISSYRSDCSASFAFWTNSSLSTVDILTVFSIDVLFIRSYSLSATVKFFFKFWQISVWNYEIIFSIKILLKNPNKHFGRGLATFESTVEYLNRIRSIHVARVSCNFGRTLAKFNSNENIATHGTWYVFIESDMNTNTNGWDFIKYVIDVQQRTNDYCNDYDSSLYCTLHTWATLNNAGHLSVIVCPNHFTW